MISVVPLQQPEKRSGKGSDDKPSKKFKDSTGKAKDVQKFKGKGQVGSKLKTEIFAKNCLEGQKGIVMGSRFDPVFTMPFSLFPAYLPGPL